MLSVAPAVRDRWLATGGPAWLAGEYARVSG